MRFSAHLTRAGIAAAATLGAFAATASSAAFQGADVSAFRVFTQIGIGLGDGGVFDDESVVVSTFNWSTGEREDTSFALTMICP